MVEKIGARFPHYHPGFFNGIFSIALTGGMLAPAAVGYASEFFGLAMVMIFPVMGTFIVFLLVVAIWIEAKSGPRPYLSRSTSGSEGVAINSSTDFRDLSLPL